MPLVLSRRPKPHKHTVYTPIRKATGAIGAFGNALEREAQQRAFLREEEELILILNQAYQVLGATITSEDIRDTVLSALTNGQLQPLLDALNWAEFAVELNKIHPLLAAGNKQAAATQLKRFFNVSHMTPVDAKIFTHMVESSSKPITEVTVRTLFDLVDKGAVNWARTESSQLIVNISQEVRSNVQMMVSNAVSGQFTREGLARQISMIIPLHDKWASAVVTRQQNLLDTFLKDGMSLSDAQGKALVMSERYAERLTRTRAQTIARTESAMAAGEGRMNAWNSLISQGILNADAQKIWLTAEDEAVCPICEPLDQQTASINDEFAFGGETIPAHPNCRCDVALLPSDVNQNDDPNINVDQEGPVVQADTLIDDSSQISDATLNFDTEDDSTQQDEFA